MFFCGLSMSSAQSSAGVALSQFPAVAELVDDLHRVKRHHRNNAVDVLADAVCKQRMRRSLQWAISISEADPIR
jgi:hypothetical protein